jgi:hypothetical protein
MTSSGCGRRQKDAAVAKSERLSRNIHGRPEERYKTSQSG